MITREKPVRNSYRAVSLPDVDTVFGSASLRLRTALTVQCNTGAQCHVASILGSSDAPEPI